VLWTAVYASSLVDWYWVRPQVDGVVSEPPCRSSQAPRWRGLTRIWHLHRAVAHILVCLTTPVAATMLVVLAVPDIGEEALAAVGVGIFAVAVPLAVMGFVALNDYFITPPEVWVGDIVIHGGRTAYVLHATMRKLVIRCWNPSSGTWARPRSVSPGDVTDVDGHGSPCAGCRRVNPECDWSAARHAAALQQRPFVV
jgi:hypothetical protein